MKKTSRPILFFGTEDFSLASLTALVEADFFVGAVITKPDSRKSRSKTLIPSAVKVYALEHNIDVHHPENTQDMKYIIEMYKNPVGVLVSYGRIIPQSIIELFTPGIINVHPSLLPKYRGPSPIESAILHGDNATGVSIMKLEKAMDAGPVYKQTKVTLSGNENRLDLYTKLAHIGATMLTDTLASIIDETLTPTPQIESEATYCNILTKQQTDVDPTTMTAGEIERKVRAHLGFPKTRIQFYNAPCIITNASVATASEAKVNNNGIIPCKNNTFLRIDTLIAPSGKEMTAQSFLRGHK